MKEKLLLAFLVFLSFTDLSAQGIVITEKNGPAVFPIVSGSGPTTIYVSRNDHWLMQRAAELLRQDIEMLTGQKTTIISTWPTSSEHLIVIGSLDSSDIIKQLAAENKIQINSLTGQWEKFLIQTVKEPAKGVS